MKHIQHSTVNLGDLVLSFSWALDLATPKVFRHATRVAYIVESICNMLNINGENHKNILLASPLHDSGISSSEMRMEALQFVLGDNAQAHCTDGYLLLKDYPYFASVAHIILHHHSHWDKLEEEAKKSCGAEYMGSIVHLADRIEISINREEFILKQRDKILNKIREYSGTLFAPELVEVFAELAQKEAFWLELESDYSTDMVAGTVRNYNIVLPYSEIRKLALIFAEIIDRKSPFTRKHSQGVAQIATMLAKSFGFSEYECQQMEIAGLLHDLGKLSIPDHILEKPMALDNQEMLLMKQHPFYTYHLLSRIEAFNTIKEWASFHHEKLNGKGYPFGLNARHIPLGARIMAVSDVYQALTDERPYRNPMGKKEAFSILQKMVQEKHLDGDVVKMLQQQV